MNFYRIATNGGVYEQSEFANTKEDICMRKIIVLSFITLDGVMQASGGPEEDSKDSFLYGGWSVA